MDLSKDQNKGERRMSETNEEKKKPAFYIFEEMPNGNSVYIGEAFNHKAGKGMHINIADRSYVAYPPKQKDKPSP